VDILAGGVIKEAHGGKKAR